MPGPNKKRLIVNSVEGYGRKGATTVANGAAYATSMRARQNLSTAGGAVPGTLEERRWSR